MKISEIGPHDHGFKANALEIIIGSDGKTADVFEVSKQDAELVEHVVEHHIREGSNKRIERVYTGEPNLSKFIISPTEVIYLPFHVTSPEVIQGPPPISKN